MVTQYTEYSSISSDIQNLIANKVGLLDDYILFQTGEYEYTALIKDNATKDVKQITVTRSGNYNSGYTVRETTADKFEYSVSNEFYCFSNQRIGKSLNCPIYEQTTSYSVVIMCCFLCFAVLFKGALFRCLRK